MRFYFLNFNRAIFAFSEEMKIKLAFDAPLQRKIEKSLFENAFRQIASRRLNPDEFLAQIFGAQAKWRKNDLVISKTGIRSEFDAKKSLKPLEPNFQKLSPFFVEIGKKKFFFSSRIMQQNNSIAKFSRNKIFLL